MTDISDVRVLLSNFEGQDSVSVREFLSYASMILEETTYRKATANTREACAKVAETEYAVSPNGKDSGDRIAAKIRERLGGN